jgi:hypothetical protein
VFDLARLNQRQRFEEFVHRPDAAWERDECVRILEQQHLAHEKVPASNPPIEVPIWSLLR